MKSLRGSNQGGHRFKFSFKRHSNVYYLYQVLPLDPSNASSVISPGQLGTKFHLLLGQIVGSGTVELTQHLLPTWQELMFPIGSKKLNYAKIPFEEVLDTIIGFFKILLL